MTFSLKALPGGSFLFGSPEGEEDRGKDEGPQVEVRVSPFWIGTHGDLGRVQGVHGLAGRAAPWAGVAEPTAQDPWSDAVSRPTPPYVPLDFNMGIEGYPAICTCAVRREAVHEVALHEDRPLVPAPDRGRVGVRLPRRNDHCLVLR